MMTIDELLAAAQEYTRLAIIEGANVGASHEIRALFAQLAQAAAQTAQAMILNGLVTATVAGANQETFRPALRVFGDFYQPQP